MNVRFHRNFRRGYAKLPARIRSRFKQRLKLFQGDPFHPLLNNHALHGEWRDFRSINVTGDFRALYRMLGNDVAEFVLIDTHGELYG